MQRHLSKSRILAIGTFASRALDHGVPSVRREVPWRQELLARLRKICLALPEAHEVEAWGEPTFRVRNKLFAMYASPTNHHGGGRPAVWCKAGPGNQGLMVQRQSRSILRASVRGSERVGGRVARRSGGLGGSGGSPAGFVRDGSSEEAPRFARALRLAAPSRFLLDHSAGNPRPSGHA